jgi:hypothetical protein
MQKSVLVFPSRDVSASHLLGHSAYWELGGAGMYIRTCWEEFQCTFSECWACMLSVVCEQMWVRVDTTDGLLHGAHQYGAYSGSLQDSLSRGII